MEAIILAGGLGIRLKSMISDLPKPMAPIGGKPFLAYLFRYLQKQGINKVILATGYLHEKIEAYFGSKFEDISIVYSREDKPLGTGGGIKKAFAQVSGERVFVLNGDTFFNVELQELANKHLKTKAGLTLALKPMRDIERYGTVMISGDKVVGFKEKQYRKSGNINGGVYMMERDLLARLDLPDKFSFENFMEENVEGLWIGAYCTDSYFIDIGIPEDYLRAQRELDRQVGLETA